MMRFNKSDFIPCLQDAGMDDVILSAFARSVTLAALTEAIDNATTWNLSEADVAYYVGQRGGLGLTVTGGSLPGAIERPDAPTGIGAGVESVWFTTPDTGTEIVRWYVNGALVLRREHDLATDRSATLAELGMPQAGDVVQIAIEANGVVGWWGRITL